MSFEDSSVTPMTSQDSLMQMDDDDETIGGYERGEYLDLVAGGHFVSASGSQTEGSNAAGAPTGAGPSQNQEDSQDDPLKNAFGKRGRGRAKTSIIHKEMTIITLPDGTVKRKCNWCAALFVVDQKNHSTSTAKTHVENCIKRKLGRKTTSTQTKINLSTVGDDDNIPSLETWKYNHAKVRELAAHMVLGHEFPFSIMEGVIFNKFLKEIYPWYIRITRHTVKTDCESFYHGEKEKMKEAMTRVNRIGLTTDLWWSGEQKIGYMVVTSHFIDSKWQLHKRVLAFMNVPPPHTGEVIARKLIGVMDDWRIKDKVVSITVDNASANDNCIARLKSDFTSKKKLVLGGQLFHVRCCAHILNLLVQDGLDVIKNVVDKIRGGVKYILNSESRCKEFGKIVKLLGLDGRLQVLDTKTRWNSTWFMLSTACFYRTIWPRYAEVNVSFAHYLPSEEDWENVHDICDFLEVFADITEIISGSHYPTVNLFLAELWRVKHILETNIQSDKPHLQKMAVEMKLKYDKYWSQCDILLSIGAFLDPRYKMVFIKWVYPYMYGEDATKNKEMLLSNILYLFKEYEKIYKKSDIGQDIDKSVESNSGFGKGLGKKSYEMYLNTFEVIDNAKSDLDYYIDENVFKVPPEVKFDVLQWWMVNEPKYPILSKLAKDVLSIPVTTVASESTFSAGKRIIDPKRASMKVSTVEMVLCGSDWVKEMYGLKKGKGKGTSILEVEEEKLEYDFSKITMEESGAASNT